MSTSQAGSRIRFEQGLEGGRAIATGDAVLVVVVDVLSFTTCVSVAADRGIAVIPAPLRDERAARLAEEHGAVLAGPRTGSGTSLSPASIRRARGVERLVLPSPNGATLSAALAERGEVVAGSLRNASAVAAACAQHLARDAAASVAVVAAGERWSDGSSRPAWEDVWGAGAVLAALGRDRLASPEALAAADAYRSAARRALPLAGLASALELSEAGFAEDVAIAAEEDASTAVPRLVDGVFTHQGFTEQGIR
ncbi:2-phosphosulfolactate phosphatase [Amnibacterium setariae]|uniref:Probable 2-phosphosulfolactate phosphatase n=1 Tax=Amnibacterium setariae TaxID=2306585 RepID=A0A3A1U716_9MICO|nr:2-phosphosulfolactate phosphatase [Amnibacterium setariae]RIX30089.1 phosphosulfolactate phosphohydrolase [Amnibacterium setariae]